MNTPRAGSDQSPEFVVSDLRPDQLLMVMDAIARAARDGDGKELRLTSPEDAEKLIDRVLQSFCRSYPASGKEGLYKYVVRLVDRSMVQAVLGRVDGCQVRAAEILGISRNTLRNKMKELGLK